MPVVLRSPRQVILKEAVTRGIFRRLQRKTG